MISRNIQLYCMENNENVKLTLSEICKLNKLNKLVACENVPSANCDYDDGWEDAIGYYAVEDLVDLILYFNGQKNFCEGADAMLGLQKQDHKEYLKNLMQIFNDKITVIKDNEKYMLYGEIDEFTAIEINSIKQNLIEQDERYIKELKTFQNF